MPLPTVAASRNATPILRRIVGDDFAGFAAYWDSPFAQVPLAADAALSGWNLQGDDRYAVHGVLFLGELCCQRRGCLPPESRSNLRLPARSVFAVGFTVEKHNPRSPMTDANPPAPVLTLFRIIVWDDFDFHGLGFCKVWQGSTTLDRAEGIPAVVAKENAIQPPAGARLALTVLPPLTLCPMPNQLLPHLAFVAGSGILLRPSHLNGVQLLSGCPQAWQSRIIPATVPRPAAVIAARAIAGQLLRAIRANNSGFGRSHCAFLSGFV
jgi:hypothetical protein